MLAPFPGNINELGFALEPYAQLLEQTGGHTPEFVNPKYADSTRSRFVAAARLECLMQDIALSLAPTAAVGYTLLPAWLAFSPMKNALDQAAAKWRQGTPPASVASGELDQYRANTRLLLAAASPRARVVHTLAQLPSSQGGCAGDGGDAATDGKESCVFEPAKMELGGVVYEQWPLVVFNEGWAPTLAALAACVAGTCVLTARSMLVVDCDARSTLVIRRLVLDGALVLRVRNGASVVVDCAAPVVNGGVAIAPIDTHDPAHTRDERIRGFCLCRRAAAVVDCATPGSHTTVTDATIAAATRCADACGA